MVHDEQGRGRKAIVKTGAPGAPRRQRGAGCDHPQFAILDGARGIGRRGFGPAVGVRMIPADDRLARAACVAMRRQQRRRIDLEAAFGMGGDIGGFDMRDDGARRAEQQAARLPLPVARGVGQDRVPDMACNPPVHADIG